MRFKNISLTGYKNYGSRTFDFTERVIGICGLNGKGKTNLLDALHYLSFTKSYFSKSDALNTKFGAEGFRLEATLENAEHSQQVVCIYRANAKKEFYHNGVAYEKFSQHVGKYPTVVIAPDDIAIVTGSSEERRKFLDTLISQVDAAYLQQLIRYNKILIQRNSFLKNESNGQRFDFALLDILDEQLVVPGNYIHNIRQKTTLALVSLIQDFYAKISGNKESVSLEYNSMLNNNSFQDLLLASRQKDRQLQRTNTGIHRDDLIFLLNENVFKSTASQGQRKSLLFACKLAEFEILKKAKSFAPVLLLDDVFEKLDEQRIQNLLQYVCVENEGQVFITDTHPERLKKSLAAFNANVQIIELL